MRRTGTDASMAVSTVIVFILALVGAGYAVYTLIPALAADPESRSLLWCFVIALPLGLLIAIAVFRLTRNG